MELTESIRFIATPQDKLLLEGIAKVDGDSSMSATIRRLIRQEAKTRGIEAVSQVEATPITNQSNS